MNTAHSNLMGCVSQEKPEQVMRDSLTVGMYKGLEMADPNLPTLPAKVQSNKGHKPQSSKHKETAKTPLCFHCVLLKLFTQRDPVRSDCI